MIIADAGGHAVEVKSPNRYLRYGSWPLGRIGFYQISTQVIDLRSAVTARHDSLSEIVVVVGIEHRDNDNDNTVCLLLEKRFACSATQPPLQTSLVLAR